jgi:hypothetical protein
MSHRTRRGPRWAPSGAVIAAFVAGCSGPPSNDRGLVSMTLTHDGEVTILAGSYEELVAPYTQRVETFFVDYRDSQTPGEILGGDRVHILDRDKRTVILERNGGALRGELFEGIDVPITWADDYSWVSVGDSRIHLEGEIDEDTLRAYMGRFVYHVATGYDIEQYRDGSAAEAPYIWGWICKQFGRAVVRKGTSEACKQTIRQVITKKIRENAGAFAFWTAVDAYWETTAEFSQGWPSEVTCQQNVDNYCKTDGADLVCAKEGKEPKPGTGGAVEDPFDDDKFMCEEGPDGSWYGGCFVECGEKVACSDVCVPGTVSECAECALAAPAPQGEDGSPSDSALSGGGLCQTYEDVSCEMFEAECTESVTVELDVYEPGDICETTTEEIVEFSCADGGPETGSDTCGVEVTEECTCEET